ENQQPRQTSSRACAERGDAVDQNAPGKHPAASKPVGQVASAEAEKSSDQRRHPKENTRPIAIVRSARLQIGELQQCRLKNQWTPQDFINIEKKPYGSNDDYGVAD